MRQDLVFALRQMGRSWRFYFLAAATLALGIGATTAIFSLVNGVLLRPLPFTEAERLVDLKTMAFPPGSHDLAAGTLDDNSYPDFFDWRSQSQTFDALATYTYGTTRKFTPAGGGKSRIVEAIHVSSDFFQVMGIAPEYGRSFTRDDEKDGVCSVLVSHEFWASELGGSTKSIGESLRISDKPCAIIGVIPAGFCFPYTNTPSFWQTLGAARYRSDKSITNRGERNIRVAGRLRHGVTLAQAKAEMNGIQKQLAESYAEDRNHFAVQVTPLGEAVGSDVRSSLLLLLGAVGCVLLIACVNVAGLLLGRGVTRRGEFAVRVALGASPKQIVRQVLIESTVLSAVAGIAGVLLAFLLLEVFLKVVPDKIPRLAEVHIDGMALGFALLVSLFTGICFGIFPAWRASKANAALALGRGRVVSSGREEHRIHGGLVIAETAISLILLAGSGLLIRSFVETMRVNPGFEPHGLLTFWLGMSTVEYPADKAQIFLRRVRTELATIPGVQSVTGAYPQPYTYDKTSPFQLEGVPNDPSDPLIAKNAIVGPHYFETLKIPLLRGRTFSERDDKQAKPVAVIDATFAHEYFPKGDAIGKSILPDLEGEKPTWYEIVGVVGAVRTTDLTATPEPEFFLPYEQMNDRPHPIILRTSGEAKNYENAVRAKIAELNPDLLISGMSTVDENVAHSTVYARFEAQLLTGFAVTALLLAAVGLYASLSEMVARKTFEIGVRMALGAQRGDVFQFVVRRGFVLAVIGMLIGLAGFFLAARLLEDMIYGVSLFDPWTLVGTATVLAAVAFLASVWPAWRAARLEPTVALREQ